MTSTQTTMIGRRAEKIAQDHLIGIGYEILDANWRRRECEIDIVAHKDGTIYCFEVKYRHSDQAGSGLEHITSQKLRRMAYAAQRWVEARQWDGPYTLGAIEVSGDDYRVTACIESID